MWENKDLYKKMTHLRSNVDFLNSFNDDFYFFLNLFWRWVLFGKRTIYNSCPFGFMWSAGSYFCLLLQSPSAPRSLMRCHLWKYWPHFYLLSPIDAHSRIHPFWRTDKRDFGESSLSGQLPVSSATTTKLEFLIRNFVLGHTDKEEDWAWTQHVP